MKLLKRLIFILLFLLVVIVGASLLMINSVKVDISKDDLPENVYGSPSDLQTRMNSKMLQIVTSNQSQTNQHIGDFLNMLIYKTIKDDINYLYDPLNGETEESQYIIKHSQFTLDYIFATLTENEQMMVTVSIKRSSFPKAMTALYFYFDFEMNYTSMTFRMTLDKVFIDEKEIKHNIYDYFVSMTDKDELEASIDKGTLDLDEYTYEIAFYDFIVIG